MYLAFAVLMAACILPAGRTPTADAPMLLARSQRLVDLLLSGEQSALFTAVAGQVIPQPPLGFITAAPAFLPGDLHAAPLLAGLIGLAGVWAGMCMGARRTDTLLLPGVPLAAAGMLWASPMTWAAAEQALWDLLCAGWIALSIGALVNSDRLRHRRWTTLAGALAGGATLVKYNAPLFLIVPLSVVALQALRERRWTDVVRLILAGAVPLILWAPCAAAELMPYLGASLGEGPADSASDIPTFAERFWWVHASYYPAVLKSALGWPGLFLLVGALGATRSESGRIPLISGLSGMIFLMLIGRREPRYLIPAIPMMLLAAEIGWMMLPRRRFRLAGFALIAIVSGYQMYGTAWTYRNWADPKPLLQLRFGPEQLQSWGHWPFPPSQWVPTSSAAEAWKVPQLVDAAGRAKGPSEVTTVGFLMYAHPQIPPADLYVLEAARRGWRWDRYDLEILSAHGAGPARPTVRPGRNPAANQGDDPNAPRLPGQPPPRSQDEEEFLIIADPGPLANLVEPAPFSLLITVSLRQDPFYQAFFHQLGAERIETFELPHRQQGVLWRIDEAAWRGPIGQQVFQALHGRDEDLNIGFAP